MTVLTRETPEASRPSLIEVPLPPPSAVERPIDVTLIVVTWNSERWIDRCLNAIPAACEGLSYEVVIYDNASSDRTLAHIRDVPSPPTAQQIVRSNNNDGFAAGVNRASKLSNGRYVFLLNPDCELEPRALTTLLEFLDANPAAAAAAPLLSGDDGDDQREFQLRELPTLRSLALELLLHRKASHHEYRDLDLTRPQRIEQPAAAALLIRRSVFDEVGPLDEQFSPAWFEDVDYCQRLAHAGKAVYVVPAARARHFGGASLEHMPVADFVDVW
ncbi:MAG: wbbL 1, partial [Acidobacteria bacterium]|nr:wbbL 1 [Acidobacteriota bacterium]